MRGSCEDVRKRIRAAGVGLGRILAARAVDLVHVLGLGVVGLEVGVADRPRGRHAVVMRVAIEVLLAQAEKRGAVELGRAADEVVRAGLEELAAFIAPVAGRDVAVLLENLLGAPVLRFARKPAAALEDEDAFAGGRKIAGPACRRPRRCR